MTNPLGQARFRLAVKKSLGETCRREVCSARLPRFPHPSPASASIAIITAYVPTLSTFLPVPRVPSYVAGLPVGDDDDARGRD